MIRRGAHRVKDPDGVIVEVIDGPIPAASELERERIVTDDRDVGMVDLRGRSVLVDDRVRIVTPGAGLNGKIGVVTGFDVSGRRPRARVEHRRENPDWGAWCDPRDIVRTGGARKMRAC